MVFCGFEQLGSYQDEKETRNWEGIPYSYGENSIKDPISCRTYIDSLRQGETIYQEILYLSK